MRRAVAREEAGSERFIRPGFRSIDGGAFDLIVAGYERRNRREFRVIRGAWSDRLTTSY